MTDHTMFKLFFSPTLDNGDINGVFMIGACVLVMFVIFSIWEGFKR